MVTGTGLRLIEKVFRQPGGAMGNMPVPRTVLIVEPPVGDLSSQTMPVRILKSTLLAMTGEIAFDDT